MIVTSLHTIPSTRTSPVVPNKTSSTSKVETSKSLRLVSSVYQPTSTRSSPHNISKNSARPLDRKPHKIQQQTIPATNKVSVHALLRQHHSSASPIAMSNTTDEQIKKKTAVHMSKLNQSVPVIANKEKPSQKNRVVANNVIASTAAYDNSVINHHETNKETSLPLQSSEVTQQVSNVTYHLQPILNTTSRTLEAQLEIAAADLYYERERVELMKIEMQQLKEENKKLRSSHASSPEELLFLRNQLIVQSQQLEEERQKYKALEKENAMLKTAQRQAESECLRLMDELLAIEKANDHATTGSCSTGEYRREIEHLRLQLKREEQRYYDLEKKQQDKVDGLNKELFEIECLVESRVFKETDLEAALDAERQKVQLLESKLREEQEKNSLEHYQTPNIRTTTCYTNDVYCEICEAHGHDVISCKALEKEEDSELKQSCYCINCDVFDLHVTEECPNQDETF